MRHRVTGAGDCSPRRWWTTAVCLMACALQRVALAGAEARLTTAYADYYEYLQGDFYPELVNPSSGFEPDDDDGNNSRRHQVRCTDCADDQEPVAYDRHMHEHRCADCKVSPRPRFTAVYERSGGGGGGEDDDRHRYELAVNPASRRRRPSTAVVNKKHNHRRRVIVPPTRSRPVAISSAKRKAIVEITVTSKSTSSEHPLNRIFDVKWNEVIKKTTKISTPQRTNSALSKMSRFSNKERKRQMRLNIIRHRQQLLQHLENVNETNLKCQIKLNSSDIEKLNLNAIINKPVFPIQVKQELIEISDTSDELISVGSTEEWNDSLDIDSKRKSKHLESTNALKKLYDSKNDYIYDLNNSENNKVKNKHSWKRPNLPIPILESPKNYKRYRKIDKIAHNAKERACRNHIAKMFHYLELNCSYLDSKRRIPSKHNILLAATKECSILKENEIKLLEEKQSWSKLNSMLKGKLRKLIQQSIG